MKKIISLFGGALLLCSSPSAQAQTPGMECYTSMPPSPHIPISTAIALPCVPSPSPSTDFNSFYVHKENYKPVNGVVAPLYVHKTIKILFHVMQPDIPVTPKVNYENIKVDNDRLQQIIDKVNDYMSNVKVPNAPKTAVCASCHITDSRFRVAMAKKADGVTNDVRYHSEGITWDHVWGTGVYTGDLNPYFDNTEGVLNVFLLYTDIYRTWLSGWSVGPYETGYNMLTGENNGIPFIAAANYYRQPDIGYIASNLFHEIGHTMTTHHTHGDETCDESDFDYLSDAFGTTATGTKICPVDNATTDVFMSYGPYCEYFTPLQIARWHRNAHFLSCRKYIYNTYPEDINHDHTGQGQLNPYLITKNETWDFDIKMYNDIIVKSGNKLSIKCRVLMPYHANIIVEPGAELEIDGGIITSHHDTTMWYGISVWGDASKSQNVTSDQGLLTMKNGATISNALHAVMLADAVFGYSSRNGGIAHIDESHFINNRRSIGFHDYHNLMWEFKGGTWTRTWLRPNASWINKTTFEVDSDMIRDPKGQVTMSGVDGVAIRGCSFTTTMPYTADGIRCTTSCPQQDAVVTWNATFKLDEFRTFPAVSTVTPSYISGFRRGVLAQSFAVSNNFSVLNTTFEKNLFGVRSNAVNSFNIKGNTFIIDNPVNSAAASIGAKLENSSMFNVYNNTFSRSLTSTSHTIGVEVTNSGSGFNKVNNNTYDNLHIGNYGNQENGNGFFDVSDPKEEKSTGLEFLCNTHNNNSLAIALDGIRVAGVPKHCIRRIQGSSSLPTGNKFNRSLLRFDVKNDFTSSAGLNTLALSKYIYYDMAANENPYITSNVAKFPIGIQNQCIITEIIGGGSSTTGGSSSSAAATVARARLAAAYDDYSTERPTLLNNALLAMESPYAEIERSLLQMQQGNVSQGLAIYNAIVGTIPLTAQEHNDFLLGGTLMRIIASRYTQTNTPRWDSLSNSEKDSIRYVRDNAKMWAKGRACAWLSYAIGEECAIEIPQIPEDINGNNQRQAQDAIVDAATAYLNINPNPSMDYFDIVYQLDGAQDASILVSDATGRKIVQGTLPALQKTYRINAKDWASGVYLYQVSQNGKNLYNGKLIKQ
jgi:hypothetical protein